MRFVNIASGVMVKFSPSVKILATYLIARNLYWCPRPESYYWLKSAWMLGLLIVCLKSTVKSTVIYQSVTSLRFLIRPDCFCVGVPILMDLVFSPWV